MNFQWVIYSDVCKPICLLTSINHNEMRIGLYKAGLPKMNLLTT
jgi:hypothetical protein